MSPQFWKYLYDQKVDSRIILMWTWVSAELSYGHVILNQKIVCRRFNIPRTTLHRHLGKMKQVWYKLGTNVEQTWNRGGIDFQLVRGVGGTNLEQTWNKVETNAEQKESPKPPKKKAVRQPKIDVEHEQMASDIIAYLNQATGKKYRVTNKTTSQLIQARIKDGYSLNDFKSVIDNKSKVWKGTKQEIYLRPTTLFGNRFDSYLNESPVADNLFMHSQISNNVSKEQKWQSAFEDAKEISYAEFVEPSDRNQESD